MRRFPVFLIAATAGVILLAALPASGGVPMNGTFILTQTFEVPEGARVIAPSAVEPGVLFDVMHVDLNGEVRVLPGTFHENSCGAVWPLGGGVSLTLNFGASMGVGDWTGDSSGFISMNTIHILYDCSGNTLGFVWVHRAGKAITSPAPTPDAMALPWPPRAGELQGWEGRTTVKFFDVNGNALGLSLDGAEGTVSEISGPFRAQRVTGEPSR